MATPKVGWKGSSTDGRVASVRFRVEAPVKALQAQGHDVEVFEPSRAEDYDTVVFAKAYAQSDLHLAEAVAGRGGRVVFDLCDNHFYNPQALPRYQRARTDMLAMLSVATTVTCSTPALAKVIAEEAKGGAAPVVVGDIAERVAPTSQHGRDPDGLNLLWFGSHGSPNAPCGMSDLLQVQPLLEALAGEARVELTVCSNNRESFDRLIAPFALPTRYVEWSLAAQTAAFAAADAAILPITINPFTACKTHNRLSSALYAGLPAVATAIDAYAELAPFCTLDDFEGGLAAVIQDREGERARAASSRPYIDAHWSPEAVAAQWAQALQLPSPGAAPAAKRRKRAGDAAPSSYQGRLDAVAAGAVTGWVYDLKHPDRPVEVTLECDGQLVGGGRADLPRDDLRTARLPHVNCGFVLPLHDLGIGDPTTLKVKVSGSGWLIGDNPILLDGRADAEALPQAAASTTGRTEPVLRLRPAHPEGQTDRYPEIETVEALLTELRRVLALSVAGSSEDEATAARLRQALGLGAPDPQA